MKIVLIFLTLIMACSAGGGQGKYCTRYEMVCPEHNKAFYKPTSNVFDIGLLTPSQQYICMGDHEMNCIDTEDQCGGSCFPSHSRLIKRGKGSIRMDELKVGDEILDHDWEWTKVIAWLHRDPEKIMDTVIINDKLEMSHNHVLIGNNEQVFAKDVRRGMTLTSYTKSVIIGSIEYETSKGVYAPLTESGTMMVDHYLVSCYANYRYQNVAHFFVKVGYYLGFLCGEDDECHDRFYHKL